MTEAAEWSGRVGDMWAEEWRRTDRSFAGLAVELDAAIRDNARRDTACIVDIGCGAGATSLATAAAFPEAQLTGIDLSPTMIDIAAERAAGLPNLTFMCAPVESVIANLPPVDLFVSRHGVMFFPDPVAGFTALRDAAAPDARLIFSCFRGAKLNSWASDIAGTIVGHAPSGPPPGYAPGPFAFADPDFVGQMLAESGWAGIEYRPVDFPYRAGAGAEPVADAVDFFKHIGPAAPLLRAAAPEDRAVMLDRVGEVCARHARGGAVDFPAAAWLWSAKA